jgi:hypothetical protein
MVMAEGVEPSRRLCPLCNFQIPYEFNAPLGTITKVFHHTLSSIFMLTPLDFKNILNKMVTVSGAFGNIIGKILITITAKYKITYIY